MAFQLTVLAGDIRTEERWACDLRVAASGMSDVTVELASGGKEAGQIVFVDSAHPRLKEALGALDRKGRAVFLLVERDDRVPEALTQGLVDDVLVHPFRPLEVLSKLMHYQQILMWDEVNRLNASFSDVLSRLHDDLAVAERLQ